MPILRALTEIANEMCLAPKSIEQCLSPLEKTWLQTKQRLTRCISAGKSYPSGLPSSDYQLLNSFQPYLKEQPNPTIVL